MHGDEIDGVGEFRMVQPDMPGLGGGDRHMGLGFDLGDVGHQFRHGQIATQDGLVADHDLLDVRIRVGDLHDLGQLGGVFRRFAVQPRAQGDVEVHALGQSRNGAEIALDRIGTDVAGVLGDQCQVRLDLRRAGVDVLRRALARMEGRERVAANVPMIGGNIRDRPVSAAHRPKAMTPTPRAAAHELGLAQPLRVLALET